MSTRRRSRRRSRERAPGPVDVIWGALVRPGVVGGLVCLAGGLLMLAPWLRAPRRLAPGWWGSPMQAPDLSLIAVVVLAFAAPLLVGLAVRRLQGAGGADVALDAPVGDALQEWIFGPIWAAEAGAALMVLGAMGSLGTWLSLQPHVPPAEAALSLGQPTEFYTSRVGGEPVRVMLPRRVEVTDVQLGEAPGVSVTFKRAGQTEAAQPQQIGVGESVEVEGKRLTFVGVREDPKKLRAILSGEGDQTIQVAAHEGGQIKVSLDGPTYDVDKISLNYIGVMGPAVQLSSEQTGAFWVFERQPPEGMGPAFGHGLELDRLETMPAAVFTISPVLPFEPLIIFGVLFVAGFGVFLTFPQARRRSQRRLLSLNEAGALAQRFAPGEPPAGEDDEDEDADAPIPAVLEEE